MTDGDRIAEILGDWHERRVAGEPLDPEQVQKDHPELADELRGAFAALEGLSHAFAGTEAGEFAAPRAIGEYRIVREIGRGGMGVVYEAEQTSMHRRVALKVLTPALTAPKRAVKRFQLEARAAGRLHHTNIVPVHGMGQHGEYWYFAMELVTGRSLNRIVAELRAETRPSPRRSLELLRTAPAPAPPSTEEAPKTPGGTRRRGSSARGHQAWHERVAEMFAGVAEALQVAHEEGVVHRDVKPSNLLLDEDGTLKLVDFGLAHLEGEGVSLTMTGDLLGTPLYMSPEQAQARRVPVDHRTDIYSLGATLYEVLTLRPPFENGNVQQVCAQILTRDPPAPRKLDSRIPRDLETIVLKAMEKEPARRYQRADELARDLTAYCDGFAIRARRTGPLGRAWRRIKRHKVRSALAAAVVVLASAGAVLGWWATNEQQRASLAEAESRILQYGQLLAEADEALALSMAQRVESVVDPHNHLETLVLHGNTGAAVALLEQAIELEPARPEAYLLRALASAGSAERRLADLEEAQRRGLAPSTVHLLRAGVHYDSGQLDRTHEEVARADAVGGAASSIDNYLRALLASRAGEPADAQQRLDDVIEDAQTSSVLRLLARRHRAFLHESQGDYGSAVTDLSTLQDPGNESLAVSLHIASLFRRWGKQEEAERRLESIRERVRNAGRLKDWKQLNSACHHSSEWDWHRGVAEEAHRRFPHSEKLAGDLICALFSSGDYGEALTRCDELLAAHPEGWELWELRALRARTLEELGRWPEAREDWEGLIAAQEDHSYRAEALYRRGFIRLWEGDRDGAIDDLRWSLDLDPTEIGPRCPLALALVSLERYEEAIEVCEDLQALAGRHACAHAYRAFAHFALGNETEGLEALDAALAGEGARPRLWLDLGLGLGELARFEEARRVLERAVELEPDNPDANTELACILVCRLSDPAAALEPLKRACKADPDAVRAWEHLGMVYRRQEDFEAAEQSFERARELGGMGPAGYVDYVYLLGYSDRQEAAFRIAQEGAQLHPGDPTVQYALGYEYHLLGRYDEAFECYQLALRIDPAHPSALNNRATIHLQRGLALRTQGRSEDALGAFEAALNDFDSTLKVEPRDATAHLNRGKTLKALKRPEEALSAFDDAMNNGFPGGKAWNQIGVLERNRNRLQDAQDAFRSALEEALDDDPLASFHYNLGVTCNALQEYEDAESHLTLSLETGKPMEREFRTYGHLERGLARAERGDFKGALDDFERATSLERGSAGSAAAAGRLRCLRGLGQSVDASALGREFLELSPDWQGLDLAYVCAVARQTAAAHQALGKPDLPDGAVELRSRARVHAVLGEWDEALAWLEQALDAGLRCPTDLALDPDFAPLQNDPRMQELLESSGR